MTERSPQEARAASGKQLVGVFELPADYDQMSEAQKDAFAQVIADQVRAHVDQQAEQDTPGGPMTRRRSLGNGSAPWHSHR